jgi:putative inorganic carbon (HCO3(-)) transporter
LNFSVTNARARAILAGVETGGRLRTMLHQLLFLVVYLGLLPTILVSPCAGALIYQWLDNLPAPQVYSVTLIQTDLSFIAGALTFFIWLVREKKALPRAPLLLVLVVAMLIWINITSYKALLPAADAYEWNLMNKEIGFAILTALMLSTRTRLEAFVWVFILCVIYFSVPSAIKVLISGGSGGIGAGEVVTGATNSLFGDRVTLSVILSMALPLALYLGRQATLLPPRLLKWAKPGMLGAAASFLIAIIGTFARTGLVAGGATLFMLAARSRRKIGAVLAIAAAVLGLLAIIPSNWFTRMDTITDYQQHGSAESRILAWKWSWHFALAHPIFGGGYQVFELEGKDIFGHWIEAHNIFFSVMAEQGFVGLALFCSIILVTYRSCGKIQRRVRDRQDLAWAADLARAVQVAVVAYCVGGMFVSIDYTPFLYNLAAITIGMRSLVEGEVRAAARKKLPAAAVHPLTQPAE